MWIPFSLTEENWPSEAFWVKQLWSMNWHDLKTVSERQFPDSPCNAQFYALAFKNVKLMADQFYELPSLGVMPINEGLGRIGLMKALFDIEEDVIIMAWYLWFLLIYHVITKANLRALIELLDAKISNRLMVIMLLQRLC